MKSANNQFNLHIGDHVTIKGDDNHLSYGVTGFTADGFPIVKNHYVELRGIKANFIEIVIRKELIESANSITKENDK